MNRRTLLLALVLLPACERLESLLPGEAADAATDPDIAYWTCTMHPSVHAAGPGKCPYPGCGMDLVPVRTADLESGVIQMDDAARAVAGVQTASVTRAPLWVPVRAAGQVVADESRIVDIDVRAMGWVRDLRVTSVGTAVQQGQVLFTFYSPDVYAARKELEAVRGDPALEDSVLRRLRLLGVADAGWSGPPDAVPVFSPISGVVTEKDVVEGASVGPGMRLFRIAPLDPVWVEAAVSEADLALVAVGARAVVTADARPGWSNAGEVAQLRPEVDPATRTRTVRVTLRNADGALVPGMFVRVAVGVDLGQRLVVPSDAVIYAGPRRVVFVDPSDGSGRLVPRDVTLGVRGEESFEVLGGLAEGEKVVVTGNFLVAAESRLKSASGFWGGAAPAAGVAHEH